MSKIELARVSGDFGFVATDENGHSIQMDSSPESGGQDFGVRPMQVLLMGLAGCSAIDVIAILKKQRQEVKDYKMVVNGEREKGKEPSLWQNIDVEFHLYGDIDEDKAAKAVELSMGKYCSVSATLEKAGAKIKWKVFVHAAENEGVDFI
ncbi:OsmC family protein [Mucilaginibacter sp.]|uniref:OsmC family protein n=1 Tax=Mucilaginibacter sp. TaxID=1882438 RepID=UPI00283BF392|nr:OsmC family protein [Mucilaginibacter sp.]MDR3694985.1 OsmC family protein [Mucilaginibacter sp.]